ncbi:MAG TPA: ABC transporter permease [Pseudonocardiaceae bacterium]|jgi:ABC-2 type transport system permease protein|nr:ABC transporter permease [Pseudonocardiaceae bacterium]
MTSTTVADLPSATIPAGPPPALVALRTFGSVLWRDIFVTGRELLPFLAQVVIQPFFMLFIFGKVLTGIGYVNAAAFAPVLLAGIVALNGFLGGLQNTTMPLILDFSFTREIEDRLLAPMPTALVAVEKMVFGALRGIVAALLMAPIGLLLLPTVHWPASVWAPIVGIVVLGSLAGAAIGMTIGTLVPPRRINIMFAVILTPLMFTGATQFPWRSLGSERWFQVVCAINPLTYISEAMRRVTVPAGTLSSIPLWIDFPAAAFAVLLFGAIGIAGFHKRAID